MALAAAERRGHIPARSPGSPPPPSPVFTFNLAGRSLPGWLTGDIWIVLVGRLGWDLNRSLSSVDTGVTKWFWFHPSCWDREEKRLLEKQTLTRQKQINGFFSFNIYSGGKMFQDGIKASLPADNKTASYSFDGLFILSASVLDTILPPTYISQ